MESLRPFVRAAAAGAFLASTLTGAMQAPSTWTQFRIDGSHNVVLAGSLNATWTALTGGGISSSPAVRGRTLFIGNNHGNVDAIDITTGTILWSKHLANDVMSQPLLYDDSVIVGEGDEQSQGSDPRVTYVGMGPSAIVALDARTGNVRWRTAVAGSAMPTGLISNGYYIEHNGAGWLTALDARTGTVRYSRNLKSLASMTGATPIGRDAFVTIGVMPNAVFALHASDGSTIWSKTFSAAGSGHGDCPPVTDGNVVICDYVMPVPPSTYTSVGQPATEHAYALNVTDGSVRWDVQLQRGMLPPRNEAAIPLLQDGVVYFGSAIGPYMHALDAKTGRVLWEHKVKAPVKGGIVAVDGRIYFGDLAGYLWALDAKTGNVVGCKKMRSGFNVGSPIVVGQTLIIGSRTGSVYAIPLASIDAARDAS